MILITTIITCSLMFGSAITFGLVFRRLQRAEDEVYSKAAENAEKNFEIGWTTGVGYMLALNEADRPEAMEIYLKKVKAFQDEGIDREWVIGGVVAKNAS